MIKLKEEVAKQLFNHKNTELIRHSIRSDKAPSVLRILPATTTITVGVSVLTKHNVELVVFDASKAIDNFFSELLTLLNDTEDLSTILNKEFVSASLFHDLDKPVFFVIGKAEGRLVDKGQRYVKKLKKHGFVSEDPEILTVSLTSV